MSVEIIDVGDDHHGGGIAEPIQRDFHNDQYNDRAPQPPRKSTQYVNQIERDFSRMNIQDEKKEKDRRKSAVTLVRRRSTGGQKKLHKNYELYRFEKKGEDWTIADKIRTYVPPDELARKASKSKGKITEQLQAINFRRRAHITRLLEDKNYAERGAEWYIACIDAPKTRDGKVPAMDVIIAQSIATSGSPPGKRMSFLGERSDLRDSNKPKGKDKSKDKDKFKDDGGYGNDYFGNQELFNRQGRPLEQDGQPFDGQRGSRRHQPLPDPIAGPIGGFQPQGHPPGGWDHPQPFHPQGNFDGVEILGNDHHGHGGQDNILDIDNILDDGHGAHQGGHKGFDKPRLEDFGGTKRRKSSKKRSQSRPRLDRIYTDEPRRKYKYGNSSDGTTSDEVSVFFDEDDKSSLTSFGNEPEFVRRGSLRGGDRRRSKGRHEPLYREHHRRGTYDGPRRNSRYGEDMLLIEPARAPRRPQHLRTRTLPQIGYDREFDAPLSPREHRNYEPLRRAPPEVFYPGELMRLRDYEKDREAETYMRDHDLRLREEEVRRQERELDERDSRRHGGGRYRDDRDRDYRL